MFESFISKSILIIAVFFSAVFVSSAEAGLSSNLEELLSEYKESGNDSLISIVVFLDDNSNHDFLKAVAKNKSLSRSEKIDSIIKTLKNKNLSRSSSFADSNKSIKSFWITPAYTAEIYISELENMFSDGNIKKIVENTPLDYIHPIEMSTSDITVTLGSGISSQLSMIDVPQLWSKGITGKGTLVCSFDTGVEGTHPALKNKWRGNTTTVSSAWFSKDNPSYPIDKVGHGTHTMGIMVGSIPSDTFGVAPGAEWISAAVVDQGRTLKLTLAEIIEAFQWALNPDGNTTTSNDVPDVILNSWGIPKGLFEPCDDMFNDVITACEAAGIITIFAAGNEGPERMTLRSPADLALTPVNNFSVGAVDNYRIIADFSSRGPSSCDKITIKPEVVAPGVTIRSSYKGGGYFIMSGSSMAAPYVAGLASLLRQAYPEASVEDIKNAIMLSAADLGATGEDNDYGHGLVNAVKAYDYLSTPANVEITIASKELLGAERAFPGDTVYLNVTIHNPFDNRTLLVGVLNPSDETYITMISNVSVYEFVDNNTYAVGNIPYQFVLDEDLYHGQILSFELNIQTETEKALLNIPFSLVVGYEPPGKILTHANSELSFSVSDFGQYGFAKGSIYDTDGMGFEYKASGNLLYEAGIIIGRGITNISSSVRGSEGTFVPSDFKPVSELSSGTYAKDGGFHRLATYSDNDSPKAVPITIKQETIHFENAYDNGIFIIKYYLKNNSDELYKDLSFGFLVDFDLAGLNEKVKFNKDLNLIYQENDSGQVVGLVGLKNITNFKQIVNSSNNESNKVGLTDSVKLDLINTQGVNTNDTITGDMMFIACSSPFFLEADDSTQIAFALVAAESTQELFRKTSLAKSKYSLLTTITENDNNLLPEDFVLEQNYPNPFNPSTTIAFSLNRAAEIDLSVYNILGQKVTTIVSGHLNTGRYSYEWNGTNSSGMTVASGIYFYKLISPTGFETKKMVLIK